MQHRFRTVGEITLQHSLREDSTASAMAIKLF